IKPPSIPVYANGTGSVYPNNAAKIAALLADHLVNPVKFVDEIEAMYESGVQLFIEVGPSGILTGLVGRILKSKPHLAVASAVPARPGIPQRGHLLAQLAAVGLPLSLDRLFSGRIGGTAAPQAESVAMWRVNGAYARRALEPKRVVRPVAVQTLETPA